MRPIIYRGKTLKTGEWFYGDLIHNRGKVYIAPEKKYYFDGITEADFEVDETTVGQFTGLMDSKGKDIYEGDIVKISLSEPIAEVKFNFGFFSVQNRLVNVDLCRFNDTCLILGNIYDNANIVLDELKK